MRLLLFFLVISVATALHSNRRDELPRTRWVATLIVMVSTGYLARRFI